MSANPDDDAPEAQPPKPRARSAVVAGIAVVVAVLALAVAAWSAWRLQAATRAEQAARTQAAATVASLTSRISASDQQAQASNHRLAALESGLDDLRSTLQGLNSRLANLETAYTNLSGQQQSGHDTLLLNDAEMLLRTGQQRYELFHDSAGAQKAYTQAIEVLAQVQNPAYAPVRASATTERDALTAAAPPARQATLDTLSALRGEVASLPLAMPESAASRAQQRGFWSRIAHAFGSIVKVSREDGSHGAPLIGARFARQTLALDLAQAQEALLAFEDADFRSALQRADAMLDAQFDGNDAAVKDARAKLSSLLAQHPSGPPPQLGGALAQLQSLRASQPAVVPAPASTAAKRAGKP